MIYTRVSNGFGRYRSQTRHRRAHGKLDAIPIRTSDPRRGSQPNADLTCGLAGGVGFPGIRCMASRTVTIFTQASNGPERDRKATVPGTRHRSVIRTRMPRVSPSHAHPRAGMSDQLRRPVRWGDRLAEVASVQRGRADRGARNRVPMRRGDRRGREPCAEAKGGWGGAAGGGVEDVGGVRSRAGRRRDWEFDACGVWGGLGCWSGLGSCREAACGRPVPAGACGK
ncbi:hypothetical protein JCM9533A_72350 [Catenuloplanes niger JCM 9533]